MDSSKDEITFEFFGIRLYKDGRVERKDVGFTPPSLDPSTEVSSKDVIINPQTGVSARLYLPKISDPNNKLPLLIYTHGGAFCMESAFSPLYHSYLNSLVAQANVVALSVEYRLAPENPISILYDDVWEALQWAISQSEEEEWFKKYVDFDRVFLAGDSAGGNITHNIAMRAGNSEMKKGVKIAGVLLFHPLFCGAAPIGSEVTTLNHIRAGKLWCDVCPGTIGPDDPRFNPLKDSNLSRIGCKRMFVCVAQDDELRDRGRLYYEELGKCGWDGVVEFMETDGENHVFHLFKPDCEKAKELMKRVVSFLNSSE
ncbi:hypothetical protein ACHQM5_008052 [Ranunculus cassubicifolius]